MKDNKTLVFFDKNCNDALYIVQLNKSVKKLKFDRKKSKEMNVLMELDLPKYTVNKNDLRAMSKIQEEEKEFKRKESMKPKPVKHEEVKDNMFDDDDIDEEEAKHEEKKEEKKEESKEVKE